MEEEIRKMIANNGWDAEYMSIRLESTSLYSGYPTHSASCPENRQLNRYRDVYPYDHSRVRLEGHTQTDYINASLVKVPRANRQYILAQGPLPTTVGHFWLTVWQQNSKAVLMLNRVFEKGQLKCHQYWPVDQGEDMLFEDVGLKLENVHSVPGNHYTVRKFRLTHIESGDSREILHFHYTTWPDFGVPQCPDTFLEFLTAVRESGSLDEDVGPPVVHCSAGIGRSGTFVLVDTCLVLVAKEGTDSVSIRHVLLDLRKYRMGLIQTPDQLKFSYLAIAEGARQSGHVSDNLLAAWQQQNEPTQISSDDSDSDEVPPVPPKRNESLGVNGEDYQKPLNGNHYFGDVNGHEGESSSGGATASSSSPDWDSNSGNSKQPLSNKSSADSAKDSPAKCILNNHKMEERKREMELRRRRKEANSALEAKVQEMKRKDREAEDWKRIKRQIGTKVLPFCVGLCMVAAAGTYYYYRS